MQFFTVRDDIANCEHPELTINVTPCLGYSRENPVTGYVKKASIKKNLSYPYPYMSPPVKSPPRQVHT